MVLKIPRSLQPLDRIPFLFEIKLRLDDLEFQCILLLVRQSVVVRHQRQSSAATFVNISIERSKHTAVLSNERVGQPAGQVGMCEGSSLYRFLVSDLYQILQSIRLEYQMDYQIWSIKWSI